MPILYIEHAGTDDRNTLLNTEREQCCRYYYQAGNCCWHGKHCQDGDEHSDDQISCSSVIYLLSELIDNES